MPLVANLKEKLIASLKENPFLLAPMAGITDKPFRSFMREMGCGIVITELVSATGLRYASDKTRKLMEFSVQQKPVGIQIFGEELEHLAYAAQVIEQMGADFVDLNFGCPVSKVVKKGAGSAILKDLSRAREVFRTVVSAVQIPVTVKTRTGWDDQSRNTDELVKIARDEGLAWVAIHGRTRAQSYSGQADWDYIREIHSMGAIDVIGNGDIHSGEQALDRLTASGVSGVMIGRGCLKNPWIFQQARNLKDQRKSVLITDFKDVFERLENHMQDFYPERLVLLQMKKFAAWFSSGYPNAGDLRRSIFKETDLNSLRGRIFDYYGPLSELNQQDTSTEDFLMGGHG